MSSVLKMYGIIYCYYINKNEVDYELRNNRERNT